MLAVLLVRGLTLPGALFGIKHYLYPNITRLADPQVLIKPTFLIIIAYFIAKQDIRFFVIVISLVCRFGLMLEPKSFSHTRYV